MWPVRQHLTSSFGQVSHCALANAQPQPSVVLLQLLHRAQFNAAIRGNPHRFQQQHIDHALCDQCDALCDMQVIFRNTRKMPCWGTPEQKGRRARQVPHRSGQVVLRPEALLHISLCAYFGEYVITLTRPTSPHIVVYEDAKGFYVYVLASYWPQPTYITAAADQYIRHSQFFCPTAGCYEHQTVLASKAYDNPNSSAASRPM